MGVNLVSYATRRRLGMEAREAEDAINDFGRDPIGEGKEEQVCFLYHLCVIGDSFLMAMTRICLRYTIANSRLFWTINETMPLLQLK